MAKRKARKEDIRPTKGWDPEMTSQLEIVENLQSPLGDTTPPFLAGKVLNGLVAAVGHGYEAELGLWDRLELNIGWIVQTLQEKNPELATRLLDSFEDFSDTLWDEVLGYQFPPKAYRHRLPERKAKD